ncbi:MAG: hypothetical protein HKN82_02775 [Akkermansiaceae bacterium]|nr:hypothetical protein [Akkermansiaceae bacterium]NNM29971.1 hypothetical protein [Akkermansiaceae bacterium]
MTGRSRRRPGVMRLLGVLGALGGMVVAGGAQEPEAAAPVTGRTKTESVSRQFVIYGGSPRLRSAIAGLAEATREALRKEVPLPRDVEIPIVIEMFGQPGDPAPARVMKASFFKVGKGFRLQLDMHLARGIDRDDLQLHILELLLYERGLRGRDPGAVDEAIAISRWLSVGLLESFRWRAGEGDRELYAALFDRNSLFPVERLLATTDPETLDAGTRSAFRASAGALVMALLGQEGGRAAMDALLADAATFDGEDRALLARHFPGMNLGQRSLAKWWALQLARMAERPAWDTMTIPETEEALQRVLVVRFDDGSGRLLEFTPPQFRDLLALPLEPRRAAIQPTAEAINDLSLRAFPGYRPALAAYLGILGELARDEDTRVAERIAELARTRAQFARMGNRTRDYLDWYRITQGRQLSGAFGDYMELREKLEVTPEPRSGPVSRYLDDVQEVYERQPAGR